jgi:pimeloyl-ACP methyl ester carboxylesterase
VPTVDIGGAAIDYRDEAGGAPPLVFLHEGLGSIALWRSFPDDVRAAAGGPRTVVYSRPGYGRSTVVAPPWPVTYMHDQALEVLPELLVRLGVERPVLIGHSDGASIALIYAGAGHPVSGLVLLAPHVFVEDRSIAGIEAARDAFLSSPRRERLGRYHDGVDSTFWGWNDVWLSPEFRSWNIEPYLATVDVPVLAVQGVDDEYGTVAQLDAIAGGVGRGLVEPVMLPGQGHVLHTGDAADVVALVAGFVSRLAS